jgi:hypothetical protein
MINRISVNGHRYVISENIKDIESYCYNNTIPLTWIRAKNNKYYLKLWNYFKNKKGRQLELFA